MANYITKSLKSEQIQWDSTLAEKSKLSPENKSSKVSFHESVMGKLFEVEHEQSSCAGGGWGRGSHLTTAAEDHPMTRVTICPVMHATPQNSKAFCCRISSS